MIIKIKITLLCISFFFVIWPRIHPKYWRSLYVTLINDIRSIAEFMKSQEICLLTIYFSNPNITDNNEWIKVTAHCIHVFSFTFAVLIAIAHMHMINEINLHTRTINNKSAMHEHCHTLNFSSTDLLLRLFKDGW